MLRRWRVASRPPPLTPPHKGEGNTSPPGCCLAHPDYNLDRPVSTRPPPLRFRLRAPRVGGRFARCVPAAFAQAAKEFSYLNGGPIVTVSVPTASIAHSILSPATVAATPDGVPVMMMSPGASATISESLAMTSGTFQII